MAYLFGDANNASAGKMSGFMAMNRCPSLAEAIEIANGAVSEADRGGSEVWVYESDFSSGTDGLLSSQVIATGNADSIEGEDNWYSARPATTSSATHTAAFTPTSMPIYGRRGYEQYIGIEFKYFVPSGQTNVNGIRLIAVSEGGSVADQSPPVEVNLNVTGSVETYQSILQMPVNWNGQIYWQLTKDSNVTFSGVTGGADDLAYLKDVKIKLQGITADLPPSSLQLAPGQWLDESGNKGHVLIPDGMRVNNSTHKIIEIPATLEWNGDDSPQPLVADQNILPADAFLMHVIADVEGTPVDGNLGDGADADKFCTAAQNANLETGPNNLAIKSPVNDGTNRKMVWTPTANFTGKIHFTVYYVVPRSS